MKQIIPMTEDNKKIGQTIITNDCLQVFFINGSASDESPAIMKTYAEHLDIFLVFEGELKLKVFNQTKTLQAGDLFFCTRSTYTELQTGNQSFSYVRLRFLKDKIAESSLESRFAASLLDYDIIKQKIFNHMLSLIGFMETEREKLSKEEAVFIENESLEILRVLELMISREHEILQIFPNKVLENDLMVRAVNIFEENVNGDLKVYDVAKQVNVSTSYLTRVFRRHLGVVPNVFWKTIKVNYSLSMISLKLESISEIAYSLGFTDQSHFTSCFKEYLHTTPGKVTT